MFSANDTTDHILTSKTRNSWWLVLYFRLNPLQGLTLLCAYLLPRLGPLPGFGLGDEK